MREQCDIVKPEQLDEMVTVHWTLHGEHVVQLLNFICSPENVCDNGIEVGEIPRQIPVDGFVQSIVSFGVFITSLNVTAYARHTPWA